jgi:hypothetical protein
METTANRMTARMCRYHALFVGAAVAALPGCGTQEISADPEQFYYISGQTSPDQGLLLIAFAPTAPTFEAQQSGAGNTTAYHLAVDGKLAVWSDDDGNRWPQTMSEGGEFGAGFFAPDRYHFTIRASNDDQTIFDGDHDIPPDSVTFLYLFGDRPDALQSRWMSVPQVPAAGIQHVGLINLVRAGQSIELVSCADAAGSACTSVSPPLARGESFADDFPLSPNTIGFRQVPTDAVPAPPVQPLTRYLGTSPQNGMVEAASIVAAPIYMSPQGDIWSYFL